MYFLFYVIALQLLVKGHGVESSALRKSRDDKHPDDKATAKLKKSLLYGHSCNCGLQVFAEKSHFSIFLALIVTDIEGGGGRFSDRPLS